MLVPLHISPASETLQERSVEPSDTGRLGGDGLDKPLDMLPVVIPCSEGWYIDVIDPIEPLAPIESVLRPVVWPMEQLTLCCCMLCPKPWRGKDGGRASDVPGPPPIWDIWCEGICVVICGAMCVVIPDIAGQPRVSWPWKLQKESFIGEGNWASPWWDGRRAPGVRNTFVVFLRFFHLALRFWNQTCKVERKRKRETDMLDWSRARTTILKSFNYYTRTQTIQCLTTFVIIRNYYRFKHEHFVYIISLRNQVLMIIISRYRHVSCMFIKFLITGQMN